MQRDLLQTLKNWQISPLRKPLILRGARQVGKSWLINELGKTFKSYIKIDFDKDRRANALFSDNFSLKKILAEIEIYTHSKIIPNSTLLFLDEIQECPQAINFLRQIKEDLPNLHVIAAGSLIDFILEQIGMPVGRVQFMYLYPMSFGEFLTASDNNDLRQHIIANLQISKATHAKIVELLKTYMWLGGMPAVVDAWLKYQKITICQELQDEIITAYMQDFYKYAKTKKIEYVTKVFTAIPTQFGKKFKFTHVDNAIRAHYLKEALMLLVKAGVAHLCFHSAAHTQPLGATKDEKKFKVFLFDIGLSQRMLGLTLENWQRQALQVQTLGGIAEQFVAQELIAYTATKIKDDLYYWHRETPHSNAEVDFITIKNQQIVPVEVKAGSTGHLRSMHSFLANHPKTHLGLKISENPYSMHKQIMEIPLYGLEAWLKQPIQTTDQAPLSA